MASQDQRQRYRDDDQAKGQAQEWTRVKEGGDPIYDAIQEAKEAVKQKALEAAQNKVEDTAEYGKEKAEEQMASTGGTLGMDERIDEVMKNIPDRGGQ